MTSLAESTILFFNAGQAVKTTVAPGDNTPYQAICFQTPLGIRVIMPGIMLHPVELERMHGETEG